ncbi:hypothetical protein HAL07_13950 [Helicobacter ailurogastricus]|uniref:Uncharacterized protein n=1 Tax=Helicobacter ailurogastricus TaxID=1578720 RepID=A0A0K2Y717_9HELI|nr:hypothetical protein HAL07_13950 [Helicobacter ailurogastricus]
MLLRQQAHLLRYNVCLKLIWRQYGTHHHRSRKTNGHPFTQNPLLVR